MSTYDEMLTLQKTSTVAAPEPPKTVEVAVDALMPPTTSKQPAKTPRRAQARREAKREVPREARPQLQDAMVVDKRRTTTRGSFEVYQDQLHVLRQVSLTAKLTGDDLSISEMVREALDEYIHRKDLHS